MKENKGVAFRLFKISTEQFAIIDNAFVEQDNINLRAGIDFKIDTKNRFIACFTRFEFFTEKNPFIVLSVKCEFSIHESAWQSFIDKDKIKLPKNLMRHLAVITVGTSRGVLHAKTENTKYNRFFLPTINVNDFVKDDISLLLNPDEKAK